MFSRGHKQSEKVQYLSNNVGGKRAKGSGMSNQLKGRSIDTDRIKALTGIVENFHLGGEGYSKKKVKMAMKDSGGEGLFFPGQSYESQGGKGMFFSGQSASSQGGKGLKKLKLNISSHNAGSSTAKKSGRGLREY